MRALDLNVFDFDYDLTWFALMLSPDGAVLGQFGGRDAETPGKYHSLAGLRYSLERALERFKKGQVPAPLKEAPRFADDYPSAKQLTAKACIHCHHVYEFRRSAMQDAGTWKTDEVWVYPQPSNVGLTLDLVRGDRVTGVEPGSPADRAGLRADDRLDRIGETGIASVADVQYALHRGPWTGSLSVRWRRGNTEHQARLELSAGWKVTDVSWRWSLKSLSPSPGVQGDDLSPEEKKALGLATGALAFRQQAFLSPEATHAGVRINDIILGADGKSLAMTARQFEAFIRLTYKTGDVVTLQILRGKERLDLPLRLAK
jgi:hypothetical protein